MKLIKKNEKLSPVSFAEITHKMLSDYAEASRDFNPIHLDETVAKQAGLPSVIAHGMLIASFLSERALMFKKEKLDKSFGVKQFHTRFKAMTFCGENITVSGEVKAFSPDEILIALEAKNEQGEMKVTGSVLFRRF